MAGKILRFDDCKSEIVRYCENNGLDFSKACSMIKCFGQDLLWLQYHDPQKGQNGLYDETRMPVVLQIVRKDGKLIVTETEHTRKYLAA